MRIEVFMAPTDPGIEQEPTLGLTDEVAEHRFDARRSGSGLARRPYEVAEVDAAHIGGRDHTRSFRTRELPPLIPSQAYCQRCAGPLPAGHSIDCMSNQIGKRYFT